MSEIMRIWKKLYCKWIKLRLQPIRVFCLHHVCRQFDADSMNQCDWMELSIFKTRIIEFQEQGYQFITLSKAYEYLKRDFIRSRKYAVLTFDDGYKSLLEVLPWLEEQQVPVTLFINGKYLDGHSYRKDPKESYLTYDELFSLNSPLIEIGHHGWEHTSVQYMDENELKDSIVRNLEILSKHPRYIPFWAYTWGISSASAASCLKLNDLTPVTIKGRVNYRYAECIDREIL